MVFNVPIFLTWLRVALIPVFVGLFYLPDTWLSLANKNMASAVVFAAAALTDWFDGFLARKWNQTSSFGAFLDPVADKLMVAAALILLVQLKRTDAWLAVVIIGREITVSALREWVSRLGREKNLTVASIGKLKTSAQMVAILFLLWFDPRSWLGISIQVLGTVALYLACILTLLSMVYYLRPAARQFR